MSFNGLEGHLVTISSAAENTFVRDLVALVTPDAAWLGLTDQQIEGTFRWVTGEPLVFENWFPGEPNNFNNVEDCVEIDISLSDGKWNDLDCVSSRIFVVEYGIDGEAAPAFGWPALATLVLLLFAASYRILARRRVSR
jgi:hypothetical protein